MLKYISIGKAIAHSGILIFPLMKKIKLITLILLFSLMSMHSYAQLSKGTITFGGGLTGSADTHPSDPYQAINYSFQIRPSIGYFVTSKFELGIITGYGLGYSKNELHSNGQVVYRSISNEYTIGPSCTYYFLNTDSKFNFYLQGSVLPRLTHREYFYVNPAGGDYTELSDVLDVNSSVIPGVIYFITPKFGIFTNIGSLQYLYSQNDDAHSHRVNLNFNLSSLNFGFKYHMNRK